MLLSLPQLVDGRVEKPSPLAFDVAGRISSLICKIAASDAAFLAGEIRKAASPPSAEGGSCWACVCSQCVCEGGWLLKTFPPAVRAALLAAFAAAAGFAASAAASMQRQGEEFLNLRGGRTKRQPSSAACRRSVALLAFVGSNGDTTPPHSASVSAFQAATASQIANLAAALLLPTPPDSEQKSSSMAVSSLLQWLLTPPSSFQCTNSRIHPLLHFSVTELRKHLNAAANSSFLVDAAEVWGEKFETGAPETPGQPPSPQFGLYVQLRRFARALAETAKARESWKPKTPFPCSRGQQGKEGFSSQRAAADLESSEATASPLVLPSMLEDCASAFRTAWMKTAQAMLVPSWRELASLSFERQRRSFSNTPSRLASEEEQAPSSMLEVIDGSSGESSPVEVPSEPNAAPFPQMTTALQEEPSVVIISDDSDDGGKPEKAPSCDQDSNCDTGTADSQPPSAQKRKPQRVGAVLFHSQLLVTPCLLLLLRTPPKALERGLPSSLPRVYGRLFAATQRCDLVSRLLAADSNGPPRTFAFGAIFGAPLGEWMATLCLMAEAAAVVAATTEGSSATGHAATEVSAFLFKVLREAASGEGTRRR